MSVDIWAFLCCVLMLCVHTYLCLSVSRDGTTSPVDPYSSVPALSLFAQILRVSALWFPALGEVACLRSQSQRLGTKSLIPRPRPPSSSQLPQTSMMSCGLHDPWEAEVPKGRPCHSHSASDVVRPREVRAAWVQGCGVQKGHVASR